MFMKMFKSMKFVHDLAILQIGFCEIKKCQDRNYFEKNQPRSWGKLKRWKHWVQPNVELLFGFNHVLNKCLNSKFYLNDSPVNFN